MFELTGSYQNVPRWLHEGFALASEEARRNELDQIAKKAAHEGHFLPLAMLTIVDPAKQNTGGAGTYYAEAQAFVRFLIDRYGPVRFREFILVLSKGAGFEEAITKAYEGKAAGLGELESEFISGLNHG